jgi:hypothetical protein
MRIYVASSWRNLLQAGVVGCLRDAGHEVYDFKNPAPGNNGFGWQQVDPDWKSWNVERYVRGLEHPVAMAGFTCDMNGMEWAEACVCVLPCGRSAHLEAGWFAGRGAPLHFLVPDGHEIEPELMYLLAGPPRQHIHATIEELVEALKRYPAAPVSPDGKRPRVFLENPENDMGMLYCGTVRDRELPKGIGHLVEGEIDGLQDGESVNLVAMVKHMTDAEVESLPDV